MQRYFYKLQSLIWLKIVKLPQIFFYCIDSSYIFILTKFFFKKQLHMNKRYFPLYYFLFLNRVFYPKNYYYKKAMIFNDKNSIGPKILWMQIFLYLLFLSLFPKLIAIKILNYFINCDFSQHWGHNLYISKSNDKSM
jgi:hypothetical protein